jgi:signal transduction histidine kinase
MQTLGKENPGPDARSADRAPWVTGDGGPVPSDPDPSLSEGDSQVRLAALRPVQGSLPAEGGLPRRRTWLAIGGAAAVAPLVGAVRGVISGDHLLMAVLAGLLAERTLTWIRAHYRRELAANLRLLQDQVRERAAEVELANIALRQEMAERSGVQQHLVDAERLAVAGGVAAGVCHEIRNPLAALMGNIELAADRCGSEALAPTVAEDLRSLLQAALEGARQIEAVTGDLQTLARPGSDSGGSAELRAAVQSSVRLAMPYLRAHCHLTVDVDDRRVLIPAPRLVQLVLNLLINAAKAARPDLQNDIAVRTVLAAEGFVAIEVQDTGVGMDAAVQQRVFEPFFTTRRSQGGTGLGLYLSRTIARSCGGSLTFRSSPGLGTTFRLTLPAER